MSHPNPSHERSNEYPSDDYKPVGAKSKALKKRIHPVSKIISQLETRKGEAPLSKLKRLLK